jgi:hypothetical protein
MTNMDSNTNATVEPVPHTPVGSSTNAAKVGGKGGPSIASNAAKVGGKGGPSIAVNAAKVGGKRKLSKWNKFVKKVYTEEHRKNKNFQFKDALKKASTMKKKGHYGGADEMEVQVVEQGEMPVEQGEMPVEEKEMAGGKHRRGHRTRKNRKSRRHHR